MTDLRQTSEYASYLNSLGWQVEKINGNYYFLKRFLFWHILKIQRVEKLDLKALEILNKKYKILKIYFEPQDKFKFSNSNFQFKQNKHFFLPTKTLQIDLSQSLEKIFSSLHQKTRYNIKLALKKKFKITESPDIDLFINLWSRNREGLSGKLISQKNNIKKLYQSFGNKSQILFAIYQEKVVAGLLILQSPDSAFYMYAFTTEMGKNLFAPTLLTWTAIENSKKKGLKVFDFDGIYDPRFPLKDWQGFTKFKEGFGGKEIEYPGCFEKISWKNIIKL